MLRTVLAGWALLSLVVGCTAGAGSSTPNLSQSPAPATGVFDEMPTTEVTEPGSVLTWAAASDVPPPPESPVLDPETVDFAGFDLPEMPAELESWFRDFRPDGGEFVGPDDLNDARSLGVSRQAQWSVTTWSW